MILSHEIKLDPTSSQVEYFKKACGVSRFVYNWGLWNWNESYRKGEKTSGFILNKKFNKIKHSEFPWSNEVHRDCTLRPFFNLQNAFNYYFDNVKKGEEKGYPKFKKKGYCKDCFYISNDRISFNSKRVNIPRLGWVKMKEELRFSGKIMFAYVKRVADKWFVCVSVDVGDNHKKERKSDNVVGIDLGVKNTLTLSNGEILNGPKPLRKNAVKFRRLHKSVSRKQKGSNNREKAKIKLTKCYYKTACVRKDFLHKTSTKICCENQAIGLEGLNIDNMKRNHTLAKAISDEGWGYLRYFLTYKSKIYNNEITLHDRFYPSTKTCSHCGNVKSAFSLDERVYCCEKCGIELDRDLNAAINLKPTVGHTERKACGQDVIPKQLGYSGRSKNPTKERQDHAVRKSCVNLVCQNS